MNVTQLPTLLISNMNQLAILLLVVSSGVLAQNSRFDIPEDAKMTFTDLANKYVQKGEDYDLEAEDGYILKLFRIPGDVTKPILLIHGAVASSDSFILRGNTSLAVALSRHNYDIWAINLRGNRYSRRHNALNPDTDNDYWGFSVHEYGYYDLPVTIDFILNTTKQSKISAIGYSEGTTAMYVLGVTRPEYNDKIKVFISMAPICYLHNTQSYVSLLMDIGPILNEGFIALEHEEILGYNSSTKALVDQFCLQRYTGYELCLRNGLFLITGPHANEIENSFLPVILGHFPAGTSRKNLMHLTQIRANKRFINYDYGTAGNMVEYNSATPPEYDLKKLTMKIALIAAKNDRISTIKDVSLLKKRLPNVVEYRIMKNDAFNHLDYIWGKNTHKTLFPYIFKILRKYQ